MEYIVNIQAKDVSIAIEQYLDRRGLKLAGEVEFKMSYDYVGHEMYNAKEMIFKGVSCKVIMANDNDKQSIIKEGSDSNGG